MSARQHKRRKSHGVRTVGLLLCLAFALYLFLRPSLVRMQGERDHLHSRFAALLRSNPALAEVPSTGDAALGIPLPYVRDLLEAIAPKWLNDARLHLSGLTLREGGELHKRTLLGELRLGAWRLELDIRGVDAVLRPGKPRVTPAADGRLAVHLPVTIVRGHGEARLHFSWDAAGVAHLVCRDFDLERAVAGDVVPQTHDLSGEFVLTAERGTVFAEPRLHAQPWRLYVRPSKATWQRVRAALAEQDSFFKCGIAMHPDEVVDKLERRLAEGFVVHLPALRLAPVRIPAAFRYSIDSGRELLDLAVVGEELRVTGGNIWLSASISASRAAGTPAPTQDAASPEPATPEPTPSPSEGAADAEPEPTQP